MATPAFAQNRRQVRVPGRQVRTVDAHAHTFVPAGAEVVRSTDLERSVAGSLKGLLLLTRSASLMNTRSWPIMSDERLRAMDAQRIDVEVLSINLTNDDRVAILGGNLTKLLQIS